jgi:hypothetical protein
VVRVHLAEFYPARLGLTPPRELVPGHLSTPPS